MKIASASALGYGSAMKPEPAKRATEFPPEKVDLNFCRPFTDLRSFRARIPGLKRRAIFTLSATADETPRPFGKGGRPCRKQDLPQETIRHFHGNQINFPFPKPRGCYRPGP